LTQFYRDTGQAARQRQRPRPASPGTIQQDLAAVSGFCRLLGDLPIDRIGPAELEEFAAAREKEPRGRGPGGEVSPNTIRKDLIHLRSVLKAAVAAGLLAGLPAFPQVLPADPRQIDTWSFEEVGIVLSAAASCQPLQNLLGFIYNTGLRIGSAMRATWDMVDREEPDWLFLPRRIMKGGRHDHRVFLNPSARRAIEEVRGEFVKDARLFGRWRWPSGKSGLCALLRRLLRASGLPPHRRFAFHAVRGACYNGLAAIDPFAASLVLGWRTTIGLRHYADRRRMVPALLALPQPAYVRQRMLF
jgi:integrase